ncbi:hypothetical protein [Nitrososphaera sp. AFS]|uniref:hypothetical protein n=1 Tax=Nitrososphaera sp. AFS TaxID=2301191 RepID=UPI001392476C|nr:hypothetical protein [Nitrososphaera sp. AFS]NAL78720.1 hypothetical protein [Nitrososphaera sp. AFS]
MIDDKSKDDITDTTNSTEATNVYDTIGQNRIRGISAFTKAQPQSASNLHLDYIAAVKNAIQNIVSAQKVLVCNVNVPLVTPPYADEFLKQSNDVTENLVRAVQQQPDCKRN